MEFWVYNYTTQAQLYYASSTNHSYVNIVYPVPVANDTYSVKWLVHHNYFGNNTSGWWGHLVGNYTYPAVFPFKELIQQLGGNQSVWFIFLWIIPLPLIFTRKYAGIGAFFFVGIVALFRYWGFISITWWVLPLGLLIAFFILVINRRIYG